VNINNSVRSLSRSNLGHASEVIPPCYIRTLGLFKSYAAGVDSTLPRNFDVDRVYARLIEQRLRIPMIARKYPIVSFTDTWTQFAKSEL